MAESKTYIGTAFLDLDIRQREYLISDGILPSKSILVVGGISKAGKSVMVMNMGLCLAAGKRWLTFNIPRKIGTLYLQAEISEYNLQKRLKTMLNCEGHICREDLDRFYVHSEKNLKFTGNGIVKVHKMIDTFQPQVLIIDPMYKFHTSDENKPTEMRKFFDTLDELIQNHGISIVLVHHFGKPTKDSTRTGAQQLRGASTIFDYGDSYISLNHSRGGDKRYIKAHFELRNEEDPFPLSLFRNPESLWYEIVDEETKERCTGFDIIKALEQFREPISKTILVTEVIDRTGASERTIRKRVQELVDDGRVIESQNPDIRNAKMYSLKRSEL